MIVRKQIILGIVIFLGLSFIHFGDVFATFAKADKVVVIKSRRLMLLMREGEIFKTYKVSLGKEPNGHKTKLGDRRTPEGSYILDSRNPNSKYHLAIHISYPNEANIRNAQKKGVPPGGEIMIHGMSKRFGEIEKLSKPIDWTNGCIAVTNYEMEEIWQLVSVGTPIEIKP